MPFIESFFHGEISPKEHFGTPDDAVYKCFARKSTELEKTLLSTLNDDEKKSFAEIKHLWSVQTNSELERMFEYAFRMGAFFILDLYSE